MVNIDIERVRKYRYRKGQKTQIQKKLENIDIEKVRKHRYRKSQKIQIQKKLENIDIEKVRKHRYRKLQYYPENNSIPAPWRLQPA